MLFDDTQQGDFSAEPTSFRATDGWRIVHGRSHGWDSNPANHPKKICFTNEVTPAYGT